MRFGISATSSIFPKNFLTRFRPMNVCAIMPSRLIEPSGSNHNPSHRGDQDGSPEGRNPSRPSGQASDALFSGDSAKNPNHATPSPLGGDHGDSEAEALKSPVFCLQRRHGRTFHGHPRV